MTKLLAGMTRWAAVYYELAKGGLSLLVTATAAVGFVLGSSRPLPWATLLWAVGGTLLAAFGANALNQWLEVRHDLRMNRTEGRPLPTGRLSSTHALCWGLVIGLLGDTLLWVQANPLSSLLAFCAQSTYLLVYTPLKTRTSLCTLAGAVSGALPPVIGWVAATGGIHYGAIILGATLFIWQIPHFLSLAWLYRSDYQRGGFVMLPVTDRSGRLTCQVILLYSAALVPVCLVASLVGMTGLVYAGGSLALGGGLLAFGLLLYRRRREKDARRLFFASIAYLTLLLTLMVMDSNVGRAGGIRLTPTSMGVAGPPSLIRPRVPLAERGFAGPQ